MQVGELGRRGLALAVVMAAALVPPGAAAQETRDPALWPFTASSPWNTPVGTGATYGDSACGSTIESQVNDPTHIWINAESYGIPVFQTGFEDPLVHIYGWSQHPDPGPGQPGGTIWGPYPEGRDQGLFHVSPNAQPSPGTDRSMALIEPSHDYDDETWLTYNWHAFVKSGNFARHDLVNGDGWKPLTGFGVHAANASGLGGMIREWEATSLRIPHALAISIPGAMLNPEGPVPPATAIDNNHAEYAGPVHMGQLLALPPMNLDDLGLKTAIGRAIATALQDYGAYVIDASGAMHLTAEPTQATIAAINPARIRDATGWSDLGRIVRYLRCMTNNTPGNWGGGGTPLAPPAPPFADPGVIADAGATEDHLLLGR